MMGIKQKTERAEVFAAAVLFIYGEDPKRSGTYLAASLNNPHRVFFCKFTAGKGWALKDRGRRVYAWAELPEFPPVPEKRTL